MFFGVYLFLAGASFFHLGLYQFFAGKPTLLSNGLLRKYHLDAHFIKWQGLLYTLVGGVLLGVLLSYRIGAGNRYVLYAGLLLLVALYGVELLLLVKNQRNIDSFPTKEIVKRCLFLLCTIFFVLYFRPFPLFDLLEQAQTIRVSIQESAGVPLTPQQKEEVLSASKQYRYYRNPAALLEDGSVKKAPREILSFHLEGQAGAQEILITSMEELILDGHVYTLPSSRALIDTIQTLVP